MIFFHFGDISVFISQLNMYQERNEHTRTTCAWSYNSICEFRIYRRPKIKLANSSFSYCFFRWSCFVGHMYYVYLCMEIGPEQILHVRSYLFRRFTSCSSVELQPRKSLHLNSQFRAGLMSLNLTINLVFYRIEGCSVLTNGRNLSAKSIREVLFFYLSVVTHFKSPWHFSTNFSFLFASASTCYWNQALSTEISSFFRENSYWK